MTTPLIISPLDRLLAAAIQQAQDLRLRTWLERLQHGDAADQQQALANKAMGRAET